MPAVSTRAILVNRFPFSNTSLIVSWITPDAGLIKTMAKGVLRPHHPLATSLDLFYLCEIAYTHSPNSEIGTLRDVRLLDPFLSLRRDWSVVLCAQYFADLLANLTEPHAEITEFFEIFEKGLRYLETHLPTRHLMERYERKLLELNGLPTEIPRALERGLATHHHPVPAVREKLLQALAEK